MKKHIIQRCLPALLLACVACQEQDMMSYGNDPAIYFAYSDIKTDSINHSFFIYGPEITCDTVNLQIRTMGMPTDYNRPVKLVQTNAGQADAAIPGIHYIAFDDPNIIDSICIPAGKVVQSIPVIFLRDPSLANGQVRLELTLEANDYFRQGIDEWRNFIITTADNATKPNNWDRDWRYTFGDWGAEKMRFIIQSTGYTDFENPPSDYSYKTWLSDTAKQALLEYNAAHPNDPLCEADGTPVSFDN